VRVITHSLLAILITGLGADVVRAQSLPDDLRFEEFMTGLSNPLGVRHAGDDRLFVIQQGGQIRIISGGVLLPTPFLDIDANPPTPLGFRSGGEQGLLGLAFDPDYANNRRFYIHYTDLNGDTVVARYLRSETDENLADPDSGEFVLRVDQDFGNHNGGDLHFGLDGMLYIGLGDGGSGNDPCDRAQTLAPADLVNGTGDRGADCAADASFTGSGGDPDSRALLGKILRIDVVDDGPRQERRERSGAVEGCGFAGSETGYSIPAGNPYGGTDGICDEIYAAGVRNPYRFSVDRSTGDLWIGDVGQSSREEISLLPAGQAGLNFGWRCREGFIANPSVSCENTPPFTDPVVDHPRSEAVSITGGYRYRGPNTALQGLVFYGDFGLGNQFVLQQVGGQWQATLWDQLGSPAGYGEDLEGNLYMASYFDGTIYRLEATAPPDPDPDPDPEPDPEALIFKNGLEPETAPGA
jgi:glucose/arabinose dehydrogenase